MGLINLNNKKEAVPINENEMIFEELLNVKMKVDSGNEIQQHLQNLYSSANDKSLFDVQLRSSSGKLFKVILKSVL